VERLVEGGDLPVVAVDASRLDQVVVPIEKKSTSRTSWLASATADGTSTIHGRLHAGLEFPASRRSSPFASSSNSSRAGSPPTLEDHREHDPPRARTRRHAGSPAAGLEEFRHLEEILIDRQPRYRVVLGGNLHVGGQLVSPDVERADRDRIPSMSRTTRA